MRSRASSAEVQKASHQGQRLVISCFRGSSLDTTSLRAGVSQGGSMRWMQLTASALAIAAAVLLRPDPAWSQAAASGIAGVVKDASGAVIPGVTVEASSP